LVTLSTLHPFHDPAWVRHLLGHDAVGPLREGDQLTRKKISSVPNLRAEVVEHSARRSRRDTEDE
jgi:hypothetical protein